MRGGGSNTLTAIDRIRFGPVAPGVRRGVARFGFEFVGGICGGPSSHTDAAMRVSGKPCDSDARVEGRPRDRWFSTGIERR